MSGQDYAPAPPRSPGQTNLRDSLRGSRRSSTSRLRRQHDPETEDMESSSPELQREEKSEREVQSERKAETERQLKRTASFESESTEESAQKSYMKREAYMKGEGLERGDLHKGKKKESAHTRETTHDVAGEPTAESEAKAETQPDTNVEFGQQGHTEEKDREEATESNVELKRPDPEASTSTNMPADEKAPTQGKMPVPDESRTPLESIKPEGSSNAYDRSGSASDPSACKSSSQSNTSSALKDSSAPNDGSASKEPSSPGGSNSPNGTSTFNGTKSHGNDKEDTPLDDRSNIDSRRPWSIGWLLTYIVSGILCLGLGVLLGWIIRGSTVSGYYPSWHYIQSILPYYYYNLFTSINNYLHILSGYGGSLNVEEKVRLQDSWEGTRVAVEQCEASDPPLALCLTKHVLPKVAKLLPVTQVSHSQSKGYAEELAYRELKLLGERFIQAVEEKGMQSRLEAWEVEVAIRRGANGTEWAWA